MTTKTISAEECAEKMVSSYSLFTKGFRTLEEHRHRMCFMNELFGDDFYDEVCKIADKIKRSCGKYYTFKSEDIGLVQLYWDSDAQTITNMRNGKTTKLRVDIKEWAELMGLTIISESETFC